MRAEETARLLRLRRELGLASRRRRLPRQLPPKPIQREYAAALLKIVDQVRDALRPLFEALPRLVQTAQLERDARIDAGEGKRVHELVAQAEDTLRRSLSTSTLEDLSRRFASRTETWQRVQLDRQVQAALGINVHVNDRGLAQQIDGFVSENVSLIKDLPRKTLAEIEQATTRALQDGTLHSDLADELEERLSIGEDRAKLIARDQIGKLYGQVNATRQQSIGISRFIWRTVNDERVRSEHEDLDGEVFEYPDGHPEEGLPGEPINCRCFAEPIFDDILEEAE